MYTLLYSFLLFPMLLATIAEVPLWEKMERLTWKNRVVVVYTPSDGSKKSQQQLQYLSRQPEGVKERDMVVLECMSTSMSSEDKNYLSRRFQHDMSKFGVWLVGKDGGIKFRSTDPVTTEKLFGLIDTMPMRRSEIKRSNK